MATAAVMLKDLGVDVSGSDKHVYPPMSDVLAARGIEPLQGYRAEHITGDPDLVVVGNAVSRGNPEVEAVLDRRLRYCSLPELVRDTFLRDRRPIVVAGTHGKTTTSFMTAWALNAAGGRRRLPGGWRGRATCRRAGASGAVRSSSRATSTTAHSSTRPPSS